MEDRLSLLAKQLTENKTVDNIELLSRLTRIEKMFLTRFYNINFNLEVHEIYSDIELFSIAIECGYVKAVKWLIDNCEEIIIQDDFGYSALIEAVEYNKIEVVKLLLKFPNININHQDYKQWTALIKASFHGFTNIVVELLKYKDIDINIRNNMDLTALQLSKTEEIKDLLKNHGR